MEIIKTEEEITVQQGEYESLDGVRMIPNLVDLKRTRYKIIPSHEDVGEVLIAIRLVAEDEYNSHEEAENELHSIEKKTLELIEKRRNREKREKINRSKT